MNYDFHDNTKVRVRESQAEMIQRLYPNYDGSQYCLWLVPDFFDKYSRGFVTCDVEIVLKSGDTLSLPGKKVIRTPYLNKHIAQYSLKNGRRCIYGIPILFDSYEQLCEISEIHCTWAVGRFMHVDKVEKPFGSLLICLYSRYLNVKFDEKPGCKCYTLRVYDSLYDENNTNLTNKNYDFMGYGSGWLEFHNSEFEPGYEEDTFEVLDMANVNICGVTEERPLTEQESDIFDTVEGLSMKSYYSLLKEHVFPVTGSDSVDYAKYYYVVSDYMIEASDYFDIIPESSFGFKSF